MGGVASKVAKAKQENEAVAPLYGKNALVVGGTKGIGQGIAEKLASYGCSVTIMGRSETSAQEVMTNMQALARKRQDYSPDKVKFSFVKCDAMLLKNCAESLDKYLAEVSQVDFLVESQGIMTTQGRTLTPEGIDQKLALHYYSRMFILERIAESGKFAPGARAMSILSAGVHSAYKHYKEDPYLENRYTLGNAANSAGFYMDLYMDHLAKKYPNVVMIHAAPGAVKTSLGHDAGGCAGCCLKCVPVICGCLLRTANQCGELLTTGLLGPHMAEGGEVKLINSNGEAVRKLKEHTDEAVAIVAKDTKRLLDRAVGGHYTPPMAMQ